MQQNEVITSAVNGNIYITANDPFVRKLFARHLKQINIPASINFHIVELNAVKMDKYLTKAFELAEDKTNKIFLVSNFSQSELGKNIGAELLSNLRKQNIVSSQISIEIGELMGMELLNEFCEKENVLFSELPCNLKTVADASEILCGQ